MVITNFSNILEGLSLTEGLNQEELSRFSEVGEFKEVKAESILIKEGETIENLLILLQGEVEIIKSDSKGRQRKVTTQSSGAILGEMELFLERSCQASVKAATPCSLFIFEYKNLETLIDQGDSLVNKIVINLGKIVSRKLENLNHEVINLLNQHDDLLTTIEQSKNLNSKDSLEKTRKDLLKKAEQLRKSQHQVENQLNFLEQQVQQTKLTRKAAGIVIALFAGGFASLFFSHLIGIGLSKMPISSEQELPKPASIPYIKTEERCQKRAGSIWYEGQCWDFFHNKDW
ncbi:MAG TPA: hypothetical protein DCF68_08185 [Cyanothece sp. UBA12306]|nr:hypothetical protein [Cyanothece sp. UBA12306]